MSHLIGVLISVLSAIAVNAKEIKINSNLKFYTNEEYIFHPKDESPMSDMGKIPEYQGVLVQPIEPNPDLATADLYTFEKENKITLTEDLCQTYITKIFGDSKTRKVPIKQTTELFKTNTGKSCAVTIQDSAAKKQYRHSIIGFAHGQLITMVWTQSTQPTEKSKNSQKKFYESLK